MCATEGHLGSVPRFRAMKLFSSTELMLGSQCGNTWNEIGPHIAWDFSRGNARWRFFAGENYRSSHDMELLGEGMMISPTTDHRDVEVIDTESGETIMKYLSYNYTSVLGNPVGKDAPSINHIQLIESDLLMSLRYYSTL